MSETYWHFYENSNPSFCPANKQPDTIDDFHGSAQDRFKELIHCQRSCSCDECRRLNIDKTTDPHIHNIYDTISSMLGTFVNWYFIWSLASFFIFSISMGNIFVTSNGLNPLWYQSIWLWVAIPSGILTIIGTWIAWQVLRLG